MRLAQKRACALCRARSPMSLQLVVVAQHFDRIARHGVHVADIGQEAGLAVIDDLRHAAGVGGDGHHFASHGFQRGQAERLQFAGQQHHVGQRELLVNAVLLAEEVDLA